MDHLTREAEFKVQIPHTAFISNFTMLINNKLQVADVEEKNKAQKIFDNAKAQDKTAG